MSTSRNNIMIRIEKICKFSVLITQIPILTLSSKKVNRYHKNNKSIFSRYLVSSSLFFPVTYRGRQ